MLFIAPLGHLGAVTTGRRRARDAGVAMSAGTEQQADVRRVDGRGLDAHDDLVGGRLGRRHLVQRNLQFAVGLDERAQLQPGGGQGMGHGVSSVFEIHSSTGPAPARPAALARQCRYA
jgi:hypothetical protein